MDSIIPIFSKHLERPKIAVHHIPLLAVPLNSGLRYCGGVIIALAWLSLSAIQAQTTNYSLGTAGLLVGPGVGTNSVILVVTPATASWAATTNVAWLHLSPANQSGTGSTNLVFSFDPNPGTTRSGGLTIAGQTLAVTQAGSTYVAAGAVKAVVSAGLAQPRGVAVDGMDNIYIADTDNNAIKKWTVTNNTVTTLVSSNLNEPRGAAVDRIGNVYIADSGNDVIKEWTAANSNVTTLISSGFGSADAVAVDGSGNVYIADAGDAIDEWTAADSNVTTLVSSGLWTPEGVAVDAAGNVYIADNNNNAIKEWTAATTNVTTVFSLTRPESVAVDVSGNVYAQGVNGIEKWTAADSSVNTLVPAGQIQPNAVVVDGSGNVYITDPVNGAIDELPYAFVDPTPKLESQAAGNDALPVVLPTTVNLFAPFTPTSDSTWLTISGVTNGVVSFVFTANNTVFDRTAHIALFGQAIPVSQEGASYILGATSLLEGPAAGSNSVVLGVNPDIGDWTATTSDDWLHLSSANQSGTGSTNVVFSYDANPSVSRTGTLTIAGQTVTVTQAGSTYVAAQPLTTLVSAGLFRPGGVAVDNTGDVYISDTGNNAIKKWTAANNTVTTLVSSGLNLPYGVAVDGTGNLYIADSRDQALKKWTAADSNVTVLMSSALGSPEGVAVDKAGNVYMADSYNEEIKEWTAANSNVTTLAPAGLSVCYGVAVDAAGNVYIANSANDEINEWLLANSNLTTLASSSFVVWQPYDVAVDGSGNVYIAAFQNNAIREWAACNGKVTTLVPSNAFIFPPPVQLPESVAVDATGNVYIADTFDNAIKELPYAFVDPSPKSEGAVAGHDTLPVVLPPTENLLAPFAPTSDQPWLTINGTTNGVVSFSFTYNPVSSRTAHISLLSNTISVTQEGAGVTPPILTGVEMLANGILQFSFTNAQSAVFTIVSTTNLMLPLREWTVVGKPVETPPGVYQFTSQSTTNNTQIFYCVLSP